MTKRQRAILLLMPKISNEIMVNIMVTIYKADFLTDGSYEILHKYVAAISSGEKYNNAVTIKSICRIVLNEKVLTQIEKDYFKKFLGYEEV